MKDNNWAKIVAPGHIHMGNPDINGSYGRMYGTLGIAVKKPRVVVIGIKDDYGCECRRKDASLVYNKLSGMFDCSLRVVVKEEIPAHVGLGSTTALYLAMAHLFNVLCDNSGFDVLFWAKKLGRGLISGLGVYSYLYGGLLFDAGYDEDGGVVPLLYRAVVPEWIRLVLVLPYKPVEKIRNIKKNEERILSEMPKMSAEMADRLSRILLMGILGNIAAGKWEKAGKYVTLFNQMLGEYWRGPQESVYCCRESEALIEFFSSNGALFAGQSSWGPTVYGAYRESEIEEIVPRVRELLDDLGGGRIWVTEPANNGALVIRYG